MSTLSLSSMVEARQTEARDENRRAIAAILWADGGEASHDRMCELVDLIGPAELSPRDIEQASAALRAYARSMAEASLGDAREQRARDLTQSRRAAESLAAAAQMHFDANVAAQGRAAHLSASCRSAVTAAGELRRTWPWLFDSRDDEPVEQGADPNAVQVRDVEGDFQQTRWRSLRVQGRRISLEDPRVADVVDEWNKARANAAEAEALALEAHARMVAVEDTLALRMSALNAGGGRVSDDQQH